MATPPPGLARPISAPANLDDIDTLFSQLNYKSFLLDTKQSATDQDQDGATVQRPSSTVAGPLGSALQRPAPQPGIPRPATAATGMGRGWGAHATACSSSARAENGMNGADGPVSGSSVPTVPVDLLDHLAQASAVPRAPPHARTRRTRGRGEGAAPPRRLIG